MSLSRQSSNAECPGLRSGRNLCIPNLWGPAMPDDRVPNLKEVPFLAASLLVTGSVQRHGPKQNLQTLLALGVNMGYSAVASVNMVMVVDDML